MIVPGHTTDNEKFQELDEFLQNDPILGYGPNIRDIVHASKQGEEFCVAEGNLTEDACGGFWQRLIRTLPSGMIHWNWRNSCTGLRPFISILFRMNGAAKVCHDSTSYRMSLRITGAVTGIFPRSRCSDRKAASR